MDIKATIAACLTICVFVLVVIILNTLHITSITFQFTFFVSVVLV